MRSLLLLSFAWLLLCASTAFAAGHLDRLQLATTAGLRSALVHQTPSPTSLVLLLHGFGSYAQQLRALTGFRFEKLAAEAGWLVVYPEGIGNSWNDCRRTPRYPARVANVDDVAFLTLLIDTLRRRHGIAADRVLVGGFSNGGHMALRVGLERPDAIGGVLSVGAQLPTAAESICAESGRAINALLISGTDDRIAPYAGGAARALDGRELGHVDSVVSSAMRLAARGGRPAVSAVALGDRDGNPRTRVEVKRWLARDALVELYTIHGGGHTIPQTITAFPGTFGATSGDIDTATVTMKFMGEWRPRRLARWHLKVDGLRALQPGRKRLSVAGRSRTNRGTPPG